MKRLEAFRYKYSRKNQQQRLLIPVSGGLSSVALLEIIDRQLQRQLEVAKGVKDRLAYQLHVLFVDNSLIASNAPTQATREAIQERFSLHGYSTVMISSIFDYADDLSDILTETSPDDVSQSPQTESLQPQSNDAKLLTLLSTLQSSSSRIDIESLLLTRLVVAFARKHDFQNILWGDTDSRLAAKALSSVAKGRGFAVPWQVCDGETPWGLRFSYPLGELYKSEIEFYASSLQHPISIQDLIVQDPPIAETATRNMSIDALLDNYIATQGAKYPGIMANVVRTISKLQPPTSAMTETKDSVECALCAMPIPPREGGEGANAAGLEVGDTLCYACTRSCFDPKSGITSAR